MRSIFNPLLPLWLVATIGVLTTDKSIAQNNNYLYQDDFGGGYLEGNFENTTTISEPSVLEATPDTAANPTFELDSSEPAPVEAYNDIPQPETPLGPQVLSYQFKFRDLPGQFIYQLHWNEGRAPLKTITIVEAKNNETFQSLTIPDDFNLTYADLLTTKAQPVKVLDYNFDQFPDLRVLRTASPLGDDRRHLVYLLDTKDMKYRFARRTKSDVSAPGLITRKQLVVSTELGAYAGSEFVRSYYGWQKGSELQLQTVVKQTMRDRGRMTWHRNVSTLVNGEMSKICQLIISGPGPATVVWDGLKQQGNGEDCLIFSNKKTPSQRVLDSTSNGMMGSVIRRL